MKKIIFLFLILLFIIPVVVNAKSMTAVEYIEKIASDNNADRTNINAIGNTGLAYDGTVDNNLRFIGANPNNYVDIGDRYKTDIYRGYADGYGWTNYRLYDSLESCNNAPEYNDNCMKSHSKGDIIYWRIIGVFYNVKDQNNKTFALLKLVRDESIGDFTWDSSPPNVNDGAGVNIWGQSDLMKILNKGYDNNIELTYIEHLDPNTNMYTYEEGTEKLVNNSLYYNSGKGNVIGFYSGNYDFYDVDFHSYGLSDTSKKMIKNVYWHTGSRSFYRDVSAYKYYELENSVDDINPEYSTWYGEIAIINASDYAFATNGGQEHNRNMCLNVDMNEWNYERSNSYDFYVDCYENNWMSPEEIESLSLLTVAGEYGSYEECHFGWGSVYSGYAGNVGAIKPSFFLDENVVIANGDGSKNNPYKLAIEENNSVELKKNTKKELNELFNDIGNDINWVVKDTSILKIENNTIIPLKVGVTEVTGEKDNIIYNLKVVITDDFFMNPKTSNNFIIIVIILFSIILFRYFMIKQNTKINH